MDKRDFIKTAAMASIGAVIIPNIGWAKAMPNGGGGGFTLPKLPYATNALEPHIDAKTMEIHHDKHHQAYVTKLNEALTGKPEFNVDVTDLVAHISSQPMAVRNNAGGHYNHSLFWTLLAPVAKQGAMAKAKSLLAAIDAKFGNLANMQEAFNKAATGQFGSGWAWLCYDPKAKELFVTSTPNQDNPLMDLPGMRNGSPVIALDIWEHAYYLKYQNKRADYVKAFWSILDWERANQLYEVAVKQ